MITGLLRRLLAHPIERLVDAACVLGLCALACFVLSVLVPKPLTIVGAMSVGHVIGGLAFATYLLAVIADLARRRGPVSARSSQPAPQQERSKSQE